MTNTVAKKTATTKSNTTKARVTKTGTTKAASRAASSASDRRFSRTVIAAFDAAKIMGIRAGTRSEHRFIGVWVVVVDGRVFARSWTVKPDGWCQTLREDPVGTIQVGDRQLKIRARRVRGARLIAAIEEAYAAKYPTPGARTYVRGFRTERRRETTTEFMPR